MYLVRSTTFIKTILMLHSNWIFNQKIILVKIKGGLTTFECINVKCGYQWQACPKTNISLPILSSLTIIEFVLTSLRPLSNFLFLLKVVSTFSPSSLHANQYPQGSTHLQAGRLTPGLRNSQMDATCLYISF